MGHTNQGVVLRVHVLLECMNSKNSVKRLSGKAGGASRVIDETFCVLYNFMRSGFTPAYFPSIQLTPVKGLGFGHLLRRLGSLAIASVRLCTSAISASHAAARPRDPACRQINTSVPFPVCKHWIVSV